ncbi:hypothetical protein RIF25_09255 [Thermosynechococcaceae cyanobacterium BACA0444]|uniref:Uncharacterized protein n=1 Tax=Pseudocalidococcus azoricus BACA0444 TaxID=2918990 RepID=A0AAE4FU96_9CYAN|nr:hypothetical protein [Pseudocalidococcus azoricus]MDS3860995.1 hypothetical protein [Pseudocalidococcus azoricus BACA0444]
MNITVRGKKQIADLRLRILTVLERSSLTEKERKTLTNFLDCVEQVIKINGKSLRFWGEPLCNLLFDA